MKIKYAVITLNGYNFKHGMQIWEEKEMWVGFLDLRNPQIPNTVINAIFCNFKNNQGCSFTLKTVDPELNPIRAELMITQEYSKESYRIAKYDKDTERFDKFEDDPISSEDIRKVIREILQGYFNKIVD